MTVKFGFQSHDIPLLIVIIFYVFLCPCTKVEESFNLQAMHDLLEYGPNISKYDHLQFPGVVPRSFLGAMTVAALAYPFHVLFSILNFQLFFSQYICRIIIGLLSWMAFLQFKLAVTIKFGDRVAKFLGFMMCLQFHLPFYMSRPLPNIFALILSLYANSLWIKVWDS